MEACLDVSGVILSVNQWKLSEPKQKLNENCACICSEATDSVTNVTYAEVTDVRGAVSAAPKYQTDVKWWMQGCHFFFEKKRPSHISEKETKKRYLDTFVVQRTPKETINILFRRLNSFHENVKRFWMHQKLVKTWVKTAFNIWRLVSNCYCPWNFSFIWSFNRQSIF